jgi:hypothetical protein
MLFERTVKQRFFRRTPHVHELQRLKLAQPAVQRVLIQLYASRPCPFRDAIPHYAP